MNEKENKTGKETTTTTETKNPIDKNYEQQSNVKLWYEQMKML